MGARHIVGENDFIPVYITIDGNKYYSVFLPGVEEGDTVDLVVLVNSKYVLECIKEDKV